MLSVLTFIYCSMLLSPCVTQSWIYISALTDAGKRHQSILLNNPAVKETAVSAQIWLSMFSLCGCCRTKNTISLSNLKTIYFWFKSTLSVEQVDNGCIDSELIGLWRYGLKFHETSFQISLREVYLTPIVGFYRTCRLNIIETLIILQCSLLDNV